MRLCAFLNMGKTPGLTPGLNHRVYPSPALLVPTKYMFVGLIQVKIQEKTDFVKYTVII